jgi:hypothetical protein
MAVYRRVGVTTTLDPTADVSLQTMSTDLLLCPESVPLSAHVDVLPRAERRGCSPRVDACVPHRAWWFLGRFGRGGECHFWFILPPGQEIQ